MADFYEVVIRELIDVERKSEMMNKEMKETVLNQTEAAMYPYGYRDVRQ